MDKVKLVNSTIWSGRKSENFTASQRDSNMDLESKDDQEFYKTERFSEILLTRPTN